MKVTFNHEVFRCSCTERGKQCASEFTRTNAFVPLLKTLVRKNPGGVTLDTIAASAICPFHARVLSYVRSDVVRMDAVLDKFFELLRETREADKNKQKVRAEKQRRYDRWVSANTSVFGQKLDAAFRNK